MAPMRLLASLVALQCAGIGFLVYQSLHDAGTAQDAAPAAEAPAGQAALAPLPPEEGRLRQIIREELAAQRAAVESTGTARAAAAAPRDAAQDRVQREKVAGQLAHYRSVGRISEAEMLNLQQDIARLDPASRKEMLAQLMRAMNAREIEALM